MEYMVARVSQHAAAYNAQPQESVAVAVADHRPPPVSQRTRGSAMTQHRRRQALEQEVADLQKQLSDEQTVHQILERALQPSSARSAVLSIPAFIPAKAKELLAELLLVEEEIARLEDQIKTMKQGGRGGMTMPPPEPDAPPPTTNSKSPRPSAAGNNNHLNKSMFFISQAMAAMDKHVATPMGSSPKQNSINFALPPPPTRSRHSLDKQQQPAKTTILHELPISSKQSVNPNKLSERIVKCLICIFIRLLRSSRVADMDKSGNLATSFSFRIDTGLNVAAAAAAKDKDKDRGQQDHYGIFAIQDAIVRDIGPYKNLVRFTSSSSLDLRGFSSSPLLTKLRGMLEALQQVDLRFLNHQQKLAFWLNAYNTCIMHGILQHGLPSNSEKLLALKNKATINVSGQKFNALVIENFILRQPSSVKEEFWKCDVDVEEQQVRELYGLKSSEPNILFALCCGIRSSPALRIYKADRVAMDLEKAKLEYLQASLVVTSTRRLLIPSLIHSSMHDFAKDMESLLRWICEQLPTSWSLRKSMVECLSLRGHTHHLINMEEVVDVIPFDYEFQYLLPM
ncbi:hypothetical protein SEVIR_9G002700v4 [Setaria viridis]|uniref:DUF547 domain-containing protein n=2 Tax=Setaria TaxID=4554 RepID=K4A7S3_SETIT|nr:uncharacterized protein LOC101785890 [Setaria italica]XP_034575360.1 uncharacterized protein LOC117839192 [Setaria viridis]RCV39841.1 hypothetical protein SETIT_9G002400v2 [Setaria italica]TKV90051.1 hypothetical protein SEVIR_9G002700v2 [Setaria viridis]